MARQNFDLIVFDWDGTLMDSTAHITRSIQAACRDLGLPVPDDVAASYGQLAAAVVAVGRQPRSRLMDILIAATAHAHAARLYTRNAADLAGIEHLIEIVPV